MARIMDEASLAALRSDGDAVATDVTTVLAPAARFESRDFLPLKPPREARVHRAEDDPRAGAQLSVAPGQTFAIVEMPRAQVCTRM